MDNVLAEGGHWPQIITTQTANSAPSDQFYLGHERSISLLFNEHEEPIERQHPQLNEQGTLNAQAHHSELLLPEPEGSPIVSNGNKRAVRRRTSRACDQCNKLRMKCDGRAPCARCVETNTPCAYARSRKKRGKVPRRQQPIDHDKSLLEGADDSDHGSESIKNLQFHPENTNARSPMEANFDFPFQYSQASSSLEAYPQRVARVETCQDYESGSIVQTNPEASFSSSRAKMLLNGNANGHSIYNQVSRPSIPVEKLKYPVLGPLMPHIRSFIPESLAYDLLEFYFSSISTTNPHPLSPYIFSFMFSRSSFLSNDTTRRRRPALLASMLWIAAKTSDNPMLTSAVHARSRICRQLLELTIKLLKPLVHQSEVNPVTDLQDETAPGPEAGAIDSQGLIEGVSGTVDDVSTYIHIGTVVSASENKRASLRWWNAAWSLARELRLGREITFDPTRLEHESLADSNDRATPSHPSNNFLEEQEERRRVYWAVYMVDRHLALCYNRPVFLLNRECKDLLQPMNEKQWQEGDFSGYIGPNQSLPDRGPPATFKAPSIFGFFLPLMNILGDILQLNELKMDPPTALPAQVFDSFTKGIESKIEMFKQDLGSFEAAEFPRDDDLDMQAAQLGFLTVASPDTNRRRAEVTNQTRAAVAYSRYIVHVLEILTACKLDPVSLLEDEENWISSPDFLSTMEHAISAAEAVSDVLEYDGDLSYMPYFLGIQLLQGSFLLLLIAERYQNSANLRVVRACETVVRAHETCVVTLGTEYQRNFRRIMHGALQQARGRLFEEDAAVQQQRRREVLALYRWTGDGSGLAL